MIPLITQDQYYTVQDLQRSPIPQTSRSGTFFAVSYSKQALVDVRLDMSELIFYFISIQNVIRFHI